MLNQPCSQASGKSTATQLVASLPSQTVAEPRLLLAKNMAFKALPGQQTCLSISERNIPFLLPSASVGFKGILTEGPTGNFVTLAANI